MNQQFIDRIIAAAKLDPPIYADIKADETSTTQAFLVVVLSAISSAIGSALGILITINSGTSANLDTAALVVGAATAA
jgi:hypothetical protein